MPPNSATHTVYALVSSNQPSEVRYIGITTRPLMRHIEHIEHGVTAINKHRIHQLHTSKQDWIASELTEGHVIHLVPLAECTSEAHAVIEEAILCSIFIKIGHTLTNHPSTEAFQMCTRESDLFDVLAIAKQRKTRILPSFTWYHNSDPYMNLYRESLLPLTQPAVTLISYEVISSCTK